jgi:hypothetical protein
MDRVDPGIQSTWHVTGNHRLVVNNISEFLDNVEGGDNVNIALPLNGQSYYH